MPTENPTDQPAAESGVQSGVDSAVQPDKGLNLTELIPDTFERYFAFFRPGHLEGVVPCRIKELARLKIAALNACDT